jgi:hypothetical protein
MTMKTTTLTKKMKLGIFFVAVLLGLSLCALAQQTLGGITGTVADKSGSVLPDTTVTIVGDQTKLTRTQKTNGNWRLRLRQSAHRHLHCHRRTRRLPNPEAAFHSGAGRSHRNPQHRHEGRPGRNRRRGRKPPRP